MSYGLLNWVVAFFMFVFDKNKSIRTIFFWSRKNREYRYIHSSFFMELFLLSFQDMISNIIRGGILLRIQYIMENLYRLII